MTTAPGSPARPHYAPGVPAEIVVPEHGVDRLLGEAADRFGARVALDFLGAATTYAELDAQVARAAGMLAAAGVRAGDRVALVLPNCPQHVVAFYAVLRLGAVVAEHNPLAPPAEIQEQLDAHGATVVVAWEKALDRVAPGGDRRGRTVWAVDLTAALPRRSRLLLRLPLAAARAQRDALRGPVPAGVRSWEADVRRAAPLPAAYPRPAGSDLAVLLHTGGTTGTPKAVALTHRNLLANVAQGRAWVQGLRDGAETFYAVLPFFHAFGLTLSLTFAVRIGATQVVLPKFDVDMVLAAMRRRPASFFPGVPPMFDRMAAAAEERGADLSSVRFAISGAMALDPEVARRWEAVTGGLIVEGYGMTECSPVILGNPFGPGRRPGALGLPFPSTEIRIVDPENPAAEVAPGEVGELLVRGPQVFAGYYGRPEDTAEVVLDGGWLRTGDIVRLDDGFVVLADRRKELIISGGFNVYPSQVEDAVRSMPGVSDVAVVGLPDGARGESVVAALVLEPGARVDLEAVRRWTHERLSHYAMPRRIAVLEELPRSQLGKVLRRKVRDQLLD
ncbi:AMP-binding protein [Georgenia thermotolerans]|uniref:AMP-binding protein n=1 Tax=Georgenia thermotolerans TaxID=527326 RepID=A0A7J5UM19_9MICO|nr:AMP-binding protein [Georgenia thermotolerans]KAE8763321.1 AMP-binding protein [Georgenia thermotolerans]